MESHFRTLVLFRLSLGGAICAQRMAASFPFVPVCHSSDIRPDFSNSLIARGCLYILIPRLSQRRISPSRSRQGFSQTISASFVAAAFSESLDRVSRCNLPQDSSVVLRT